MLGAELADVFSYVYDVTPEGNWEGHNILHRPKTDEQDATLLKTDVDGAAAAAGRGAAEAARRARPSASGRGATRRS